MSLSIYLFPSLITIKLKLYSPHHSSDHLAVIDFPLPIAQYDFNISIFISTSDFSSKLEYLSYKF